MSLGGGGGGTVIEGTISLFVYYKRVDGRTYALEVEEEAAMAGAATMTAVARIAPNFMLTVGGVCFLFVKTKESCSLICTKKS